MRVPVWSRAALLVRQPDPLAAAVGVGGTGGRVVARVSAGAAGADPLATRRAGKVRSVTAGYRYPPDYNNCHWAGLQPNIICLNGGLVNVATLMLWTKQQAAARLLATKY